ncbi:hypothetical protein BG003_009844, partial [Podila horticola]
MFVQRTMRQAIQAHSAISRPSVYASKVLSSRFYSSVVAPLDASKLEIHPSKNQKKLQENKDLVFGKTFTDNMLVV